MFFGRLSERKLSSFLNSHYQLVLAVQYCCNEMTIVLFRLKFAAVCGRRYPKELDGSGKGMLQNGRCEESMLLYCKNADKAITHFSALRVHRFARFAQTSTTIECWIVIRIVFYSNPCRKDICTTLPKDNLAVQ